MVIEHVWSGPPALLLLQNIVTSVNKVGQNLKSFDVKYPASFFFTNNMPNAVIN